MAKDQNPHHDDAKPGSEHSPPMDRGRRSWKIGVTIGYGFLYTLLLAYSMVNDKDVLATFLTGAAILLLLILFVWHPEHIGRLKFSVSVYRGVRLHSNLETPHRKRGQDAVDSTRNRKFAETDPDEVLRRTEQIAARKGELKSKRNSRNSAIRKGQKLKKSR